MSQVSTRPGSPNSIDRQEFEKWMTKYNIHYDTDDEKEWRFKVFQQKLREIEAHNALQTTWTKGLNPFSDMTREEVMKQYCGAVPTTYPPDITKEKLMEQDKGMFMETDDKGVSMPVYPSHFRRNRVAMSQVSTRPGSPNSIDRQEFERWMTKYNKHYDTDDEKVRRFKVFQQVLHEIEAENALQTMYIRRLNPFSDMTPDELMVEYREELPLTYPPDITEEKIMERYKDAFSEKDVLMRGYYTNIRKNTDDYVIPYDSKCYTSRSTDDYAIPYDSKGCTRRSIEDFMIPYDFKGYTRRSTDDYAIPYDSKGYTRRSSIEVEDYMIPYDFKGCTISSSSMADQGASSFTGRGKRPRGAESDSPPPPLRRRIRYLTEEVQIVEGEGQFNLDTRCHLDKWIANPSDERKLDYPDHLHSKNSQLVKPSGVATSPFKFEGRLAVLNKHYDVPPNSNDRQQFEEWMTKYNKHYNNDDEREKRYKVFQQNIRRIEDFKALPNSTEGLNIFADMTPEEFKKKFICGSGSSK